MSLRERLQSIGVLALASLGLLLVAPLFLLVFAIAFLWHDPRTAVGIALGFLVAAAVVLGAGGKGVARELAVCAYSFLATGVILMLVKHVIEEWGKIEVEEGKP